MFFWLCETCCSTMTLSFDPYKGLAVVPLKSTERHGNVIGAAEAQELSA